MILFVFEGRKTEPSLFKTLEYLYFKNPDEQKICCFGYNIYELYKLMNESDFTEDIVTVIKRKLESRNEKPIPEDVSITDFSEVYLFFDYEYNDSPLLEGRYTKRYQLRRELISALNPKLGEGYLYYKNDYLERRIKVIPNPPVIKNKNSNEKGTVKASVSFTACGVYWEDVEETVVELNNFEAKTVVNV